MRYENLCLQWKKQSLRRRNPVLREKKRLSQEQLAARMQVEGVQINQKAVSRIETGDRVVPDYEVLTFARVLGVEVGQLLREQKSE